MIKLIEKIKNIPKGYFSFDDLRKVSNLSNNSLTVALNRLIRNKQINRITKGIYTAEIKKLDWEKLAVEIYHPSYLSFEWALAYYNILSQQPMHLTLATAQRSKIIKAEQKNLIYRHLQKKMFWGYEQRDGFLIATAEKALLDLAYLAIKGYAICDLEEMNLTLLNKKVLKQYLEKINNSRLVKFFKLIY